MVVLIYWLTKVIKVILPVIACTHQIRFVLFEINNNFNFVFFFFSQRGLFVTSTHCISLHTNVFGKTGWPSIEGTGKELGSEGVIWIASLIPSVAGFQAWI